MTIVGGCSCYTASPVPALVVHGDRDAVTSHAIAPQAAAGRPNTVFRSVHGADHGFGSPHRQDEVVAVTIQWLAGGRLPG